MRSIQRILIIALATLALTLVAPCHGDPIRVSVSVDRSKPCGASAFDTGAFIAQHCLDGWFDAGANAAAEEIIKKSCGYGCVAIFGWGSGNPEPSPGVYDWASLDFKVSLLRKMGLTPVITLCGAPNWMTGGAPGTTDWQHFCDAPLPDHVDDFAALCAAVARRYPDVKHYLVWNEFKGMWNQPEHRWDYERYTTLYNKAYAALKGVSRSIQVGGPYLVIGGDGTAPGTSYGQMPLTPGDKTVYKYWLSHKIGADFIVLDRGMVNYHNPGKPTVARVMALTPLIGSIVDQIRALPGASTLPVWFAEFYADGSSDYQQTAAMYASELAQLVTHGATAAFEWQPQDGETPNWTHALFTSTKDPVDKGGGAALPLAAVMQVFHENFGPKVKLFSTTSTDPSRIEAISSARVTYLINKSDSVCVVNMEKHDYTVPAYACLLVHRHSR